MNLVETILLKCLTNAEQAISNQLHQLNLRHLKLMCNLDCIKRDSTTRIDINSQLSQSLQGLKKDKETQSKTINDLYKEIQNLNYTKLQAERSCVELKQILTARDTELRDLNARIASKCLDLFGLIANAFSLCCFIGGIEKGHTRGNEIIGAENEGTRRDRERSSTSKYDDREF